MANHIPLSQHPHQQPVKPEIKDRNFRSPQLHMEQQSQH